MTDTPPKVTYVELGRVFKGPDSGFMCALCGAFVLSISAHSAYHQELWEAFDGVAKMFRRPEPPPGPPNAAASFGDI